MNILRLTFKTALALSVITTLGAPSIAHAQAAKSVDDFTACRAITDPAERLACYDRDAATIVDAQEKGELLIIDQEKAEEIEKENFGFNMPSLPKFTLPKKDRSSETEIMTISEYKVRANGRYVFTMANGQVWEQIDGYVNRAPKGAGQTLNIRPASMGSFLAQINGRGAGLRVKRIQ